MIRSVLENQGTDKTMDKTMGGYVYLTCVMCIVFHCMTICVAQSHFHQQSGGAHVDLPGQHGNTHPVAVVHRQSHSHTGGGTGGVHVDLPGQHGNTHPVAVVHRQSNSHTDSATSGAHVDLPGQHGNTHPVAVVHRQGHSHHGSGIGVGKTHVDLPGQHGNLSPVPVVHRDIPGSQTFNINRRQHGGHTDIHVDRLGQHGNVSPFTIVHRSRPQGAPVGTHGVASRLQHRQFSPSFTRGVVPSEFGVNTFQTAPRAPNVMPSLQNRHFQNTFTPLGGMGSQMFDQRQRPVARFGTPGMGPMAAGQFPMDPLLRRQRRFQMIRRMRELEYMNNMLSNAISELLNRV